MKKGIAIPYVLVVAIAIVTVLGYVAHRDLGGRYNAYQRSEMSVNAAKEQARILDEELQRLQQRVKDLDQKNPLEVEAAIRRIKQLVRDGETVYRLEEAPESAVEPKP